MCRAWLLLLVSLALIAAGGGDKRAQGTLSALRTLSTQLSGAQFGITIINLAIGFLAEPAIADIVEGPLQSAGLSDTGATSVATAVGAAVLGRYVAGRVLERGGRNRQGHAPINVRSGPWPLGAGGAASTHG